ncbi:low-density lipoprotein receptor-related protein 4 isoform X2 [Lingula anatina]|uniref:Low-density lipoprotein receptor-related protein 4 isoform X2 n=1 Tax=Lingula anatina TaxID=7574 RepID=A0A1S3JGM4_LINAN|nr:low-density lipoprotein receptor-related protein 4 isoform X2 [Lingula anatina]|eukprot:XP_013409296.1 low-density lipoprotein receptor-related protein 4 isoform X2 [Lingula anatina]
MNSLKKFGVLLLVYLLSSSVHSGYVTDDFLIFTDTKNGVIWQLDLILRNIHPVFSQCNNPISTSYDPIEQRVYWSEVVTFAKIRRVNVDGTAPEIVFNFTIGSIPDGVTVDHISRLLYYTENRYDTIGVMRLDGSHHKILFRTGLDRPRALALDPINGWMYWTDWGTEAKIERAHMDGENRQTVADTDLSRPNGIDIDIPEQKLYWCDGNYSKIEVSDPDGSNRRSLIEAGYTVSRYYFGIAVDDLHIYFTDWGFASWAFRRANKLDGSNSTVRVARFIPTAKLTGVHVYRSSYHLSGSNDCSVNNGGCPYLCLPKPNGRTCACPDRVSGCIMTTYSTTSTTAVVTTKSTTTSTTIATTPTTTSTTASATSTTPTTTTGTSTSSTQVSTSNKISSTSLATTVPALPPTVTPTFTSTKVTTTEKGAINDEVKGEDSASIPMVIGVAVATPLVTVILVVVIIIVFLKRRRTPPPDPQTSHVPHLNRAFSDRPVPPPPKSPKGQLRLSTDSDYDLIPGDYLTLTADNTYEVPSTQENQYADYVGILPQNIDV